jgi:hypothetical protein
VRKTKYNEADGVSPFEAKGESRVDETLLNEVVARARSFPCSVMSIDQSFDCVGVAFYFPRITIESLLSFMRESLCVFDDRFSKDFSQMKAAVMAAMASQGKDSPLSMKETGTRNWPVNFGMVFSDAGVGGDDGEGGRPVILNGQLTKAPTNAPEWVEARAIAGKLREMAEHFIFVSTKELGMKAMITIEGMALHGSTDSIAIMPCLGIVYGSIWEEMSRGEKTSGVTREVPISSWKKVLGKGNFSKKEVKEVLERMGFSRFGSDDEQDAVGMALASAASPEIMKDTSGRIRPTLEASAEKRQKEKARKEKRRLKMDLKTTDSKVS